jgi:hypothetical protein
METAGREEVGWTSEPGDSNSDPSVVQAVASRFTDYAIPAPTELRRKVISIAPTGSSLAVHLVSSQYTA